MAMVKAELDMKVVIKDYKKGMSLRAIADKHFSNRTTIRDKLIDAKVYVIKEPIANKISKNELSIYIAKMPVHEVARVFKVVPKTIYRLIEKYELKDGKDGRLNSGATKNKTVRQSNRGNQVKSTKRKTQKNRVKRSD